MKTVSSNVQNLQISSICLLLDTRYSENVSVRLKLKSRDCLFFIEYEMKSNVVLFEMFENFITCRRWVYQEIMFVMHSVPWIKCGNSNDYLSWKHNVFQSLKFSSKGWLSLLPSGHVHKQGCQEEQDYYALPPHLHTDMLVNKVIIVQLLITSKHTC